jgi:hypothetical protein
VQLLIFVVQQNLQYNRAFGKIRVIPKSSKTAELEAGSSPDKNNPFVTQEGHNCSRLVGDNIIGDTL